jgi:formamidopyrimidine-DNA glycosylase
MPELPEVETTRRGIEPWLVGRRIETLTVREWRLRWRVPRGLPAKLGGARVRTVGRRAKYLLIGTDAGTLIWHLGMSGSLRVLDADSPPLAHDHVDLVLDSGKCLRFNDPRRFGCLLFTADEPARHKLLKGLAVEPLSDDFTGAALWRRARGRTASIKSFIMDSRTVAGVGNIYASEALFRAGIRPGLGSRAREPRADGRARASDTGGADGGDRRRRHDPARLRGRRGHARLFPATALRLRAHRETLPPLQDANPPVRAGPAQHLLVSALPGLAPLARLERLRNRRVHEMRDVAAE